MDLLKALGVLLLVAAIIVWGANALENISCHASTEGMKVATEYSFFAGCRVSTPDGRMVPLEIYREFKQQP